MAGLKKAGYEGQTPGTLPTLANSSANGDAAISASVTVGTGCTMTYATSTGTTQGTGSLKMATVASTNTFASYIMVASDPTINIEFAYYYAAAPTGAELPFMYALDTSNATVFNLAINTNGTIRVRDAAGANPISGMNAIGALTLTPGTWYRFAVQGTHGAGTTDGTFHIDIYNGATSMTSIAGNDATTMNLSTVDFNRILVGRSGASASGTATMEYGSVQLGNGYPDGQYIGAYGATGVPVSTAGTDQTGVDPYQLVQLTGGGSNTPTSWAWTTTVGTTQTLSNPAAQSPTFTPTKSFSAQALTEQLIASNGTGPGTPDTVNIGVLPNTDGRVTGSGTANPGRIIRVP